MFQIISIFAYFSKVISLYYLFRLFYCFPRCEIRYSTKCDAHKHLLINVWNKPPNKQMEHDLELVLINMFILKNCSTGI